MRKYLVLLFVFIFGLSIGQELNCTVDFNTDQVGVTNQQVFKTLKQSLTEFVNNTKWTENAYKVHEKIDCSFFFTITTFDVNQFSGTLQVQASRPIFNSTYRSTILNLNDKEISFSYTEFENLAYDPNTFSSNLVSIMSFYANLIIGIDADTFSINGGTKSLESAQNIVNVAQQSQMKGWSQSEKNQNRFYLINDMMSPAFANFRKAMYEYHSKALDIMADSTKEGKENIKTALLTLRQIVDSRPNAYLVRVFFDAKAEELVNIYSDGPKVDVTEVVNALNRLSPTNSSLWGKISY